MINVSHVLRMYSEIISGIIFIIMTFIEMYFIHIGYN